MAEDVRVRARRDGGAEREREREAGEWSGRASGKPRRTTERRGVNANATMVPERRSKSPISDPMLLRETEYIWRNGSFVIINENFDCYVDAQRKKLVAVREDMGSYE